MQVDHVVPKHLSSVDFALTWTAVAGDLPNLGPHHISNLRACCARCNSPRVKGTLVLPNPVLAAELAKSATISEKAFAQQRHMRRNSAVGESAVKVTSADGSDEYKLLWESDLSQALIGTLHAAAAETRPAHGNEDRFRVAETSLFVRSSLTPESARLMGAVQLVSGVPLTGLTEALLPAVLDAFSDSFSRFAESAYPESHGANSGDVDWTNALFIVSWDSATIDESTCVCSVTVAMDNEVSAQVAVQSGDGGELVDAAAPDCIIDGFARFEIHVEVGGGVYDVVFQDDELEPVHASSLPR
jgi:hypothetical protein